MFRIVICDDEATSLAFNQKMTEKILEEARIDYTIDTFSDMDSMINAAKENEAQKQPYDLLLSDVLTPGITGIDAAKKLRALGGKMDIVFISSTTDFALEGYNVKAIRYLTKPVEQNKLKECLLEAYEKAVMNAKILVPSGDKTYRVAVKDIFYVESDVRDVIIHLKSQTLSMRTRFMDVQELLPSTLFAKCHRSYMVNMSKISDIRRYTITMKNGDEVPVSQQLYKETKDRFLND